MFDEMMASISWVLTTAGCREEASLVERLGSAANAHSAEINQLYERAGLGGLAELADGLRTQGRLTDQNAIRMRTLWRDMQGELESFSVRPMTLSESARANVAALHGFGVLTVTRSGDITFFLHPSVSVANLGRLWRLSPKEAVKHLQQVASIRGEPLSARQAQDLYDFHVRDLGERMQRAFTGLAKEWTRPSRRVEIDLLPTAADFYSAGTEHYRIPPLSGHPFTVFATTPGLFLPEERHGPAFFRETLGRPDLADVMPENSARAPYFSALLERAKKRPRVYHFELTRARAQYSATIARLADAERDLYDRHAFDLVRPLLADPKFGIVGIERLPVEFDHLTLGNGRSAVLSTRSDGKIGRGMWIRSVDQSTMREALHTLDISGGIEGAVTATLAYFFAGGDTSLAPDLERVALTLFYAPIMYILVKRAFWRPRTAKQAFEDFSTRLQAQPMEVEAKVFKKIGSSQPVQEVRSIHDLLGEPRPIP
ncbi:hypothetical protein [Frankia sp. R43]|uniref:hypothetical protein n=1 Tax=Frankia sp. R43 TaxID=269536 RepID=UPI000B1263AC|nr:hypothetical protein [Frankia sp. R43]